MRLFGREWFEKNQLPLLFLANTRGGRQLLRIRDDVPSGRSIVRIEPHSYTCLDEQHPSFLHALWSMRKPREVRLISDFRCRPKFANRLGHSWVRDVAGWNQYVGDVWTRSPLRVQPAFAATLTAYPDPDPETSTVDGYVRHEGTDITWANLIAGAGTAASDNGANYSAVFIQSDTIAWFALQRGIMLFDTSSISPGVVSAATMSLYDSGFSQDNFPITPNINIYASAPASNTALASGDFDSLGATALSTAIAYASWLVSDYNDFTLNSSGIDLVSTTGITKFGTRNANYDVAAVAPTYTASKFSRITPLGSETAGTSTDPKLVVTHALVAASFYSMLLGVS